MGEKNHATSLDKKKSRNLSGEKTHATSQDKKIMQPVGPKKIMYYFGMNKIEIKNHATSWGKKFTQPLGTKKSHNVSGQKKSLLKLLQMASTLSKWVQIG